MATIVSSGPSVLASDLDEAERSMGLALPEDLRRHYLAANGGRPIPNAFFRNGEAYCVHQFFPVKHGRKGEFLEDVFRMSREYLPATAIPIAIDAGGDFFVYSEEADSMGSIWFHRSDYFNDPSRAMVKLADSLAEFLNGLTESGSD
jgi:hypothetical protein